MFKTVETETSFEHLRGKSSKNRIALLCTFTACQVDPYWGFPLFHSGPLVYVSRLPEFLLEERKKKSNSIQQTRGMAHVFPENRGFSIYL